jgi:putative transposase
VYLLKAKIHYISKTFNVEVLNVECELNQIKEKHTTKKCCYCGKIHDMPSLESVMICDCDTDNDRDQNSSINIMVRFLSQNALWTGYQQFVDDLRQYRIPNGYQI